MANPQAENGHTDLANEILEALSRIRLSGEEWQCLCVVLRKTYGWKKLEDSISLSQFALATGMKKQHVHRALSKLSSKKVIVTKKGDGQIKIYSFLKDFEKWEPSPKKVTVAKPSPLLGKGVPKKGKAPSPLLGNTKETPTKETITKEIYGEFQNVLLSEPEYKKLIHEYAEQKTKDMIERLSSAMESDKKLLKKYSSHYATIRNWERRGYMDSKNGGGKWIL